MKLNMFKFFCISFLFFTLHLRAENSTFAFSGDIGTKVKLIKCEDYSQHTFICDTRVNGYYENDDSWSEFQLKFRLDSSFLAENSEDIFLDKAYFGHQISPNIALELGRNKLDDLFDSKAMYLGNFNGLHLSFEKMFETFGKLKIHGGPSIMNNSFQNTALHSEIIVEDLFTSGMSVNCGVNCNKFFTISQILVKYQLDKFTPYIAVLQNLTTHKQGYYAGVSFGKIKVANDFSLDVNYQSLEANCLCYFDRQSYDNGIQIKAVYAVTDSIHLKGKASSLKMFEIGAVYNW